MSVSNSHLLSQWAKSVNYTQYILSEFSNFPIKPRQQARFPLERLVSIYVGEWMLFRYLKAILPLDYNPNLVLCSTLAYTPWDYKKKFYLNLSCRLVVQYLPNRRVSSNSFPKSREIVPICPIATFPLRPMREGWGEGG